MLDRALENIEDLPKVEGLFCLDASGELAFNRLPDLFPEDVFEPLGRRIQSLFSAVEENYAPSDELVLRYASYALFLRRSKAGFLGVLAAPDTNQNALNITTNLALKQFTAENLAGLQKREHASRGSAPGAPSAAAYEASAEEEDEDRGNGGGGLFGGGKHKKKAKHKPRKDGPSNDIWG